jgi:hypothetical protein
MTSASVDPEQARVSLRIYTLGMRQCGGAEYGWTAASAWARSGAMALCGDSAGPPAVPPEGLPERLDALVAEIGQRSARWGRQVRVSWGPTLAGRAQILGLGRRGRISPNGSCRLLQATDGWVALNLPRIDDVDLVPALIGRDSLDRWSDAASAASESSADDFVARARLLGLAAARLGEAGGTTVAAPYTLVERSGAVERLRRRALQVVDLSALWAGPVAARVLAEVGAAVTKVESSTRADGSRNVPEFYRWVHAPGERTVQVDLRTPAGRSRVADLLDDADIVIEASRPRALEQLGLGPESRPGRPGQIWLSITGYGRKAPGKDWIAFGDDAAVAGGLVCWDDAGRPGFCVDAVADPITGLVGALAVLRSLDTGGGHLIDLAMNRVAAAMVDPGNDPSPTDAGSRVSVEADPRGWRVRYGASLEPVRARPDSLVWVRSK